MGPAASTTKASASPGATTDRSGAAGRPDPKPPPTDHNEAGLVGFAVPLIAGGALATLSPELGMAVGALTLVTAAVYKKGWQWWIVGAVVLLAWMPR